MSVMEKTEMSKGATKSTRPASSTSLFIDMRIASELSNARKIFQSQQGIICAAVLAFLRSSIDEQLRMMTEYSEFMEDHRATVMPVGMARK